MKLFPLMKKVKPVKTSFYFKECVQQIKFPPNKDRPCRPDMSVVATAPPYAQNVMMACWAEDPNQRPPFSELKRRLKPLQEGMLVLVCRNVS
jgi:hypothetical protein